MCLTSLTFATDKDGWITGYKLFIPLNDNAVTNAFYRISSQLNYQLNLTYKSKNYSIYTRDKLDYIQYQSGFHFLFSKKDVFNYYHDSIIEHAVYSVVTKKVKVYECKFKNITAIGKQESTFNKYVSGCATTMKIIKRIENV